jgi:hypothetical protein
MFSKIGHLENQLGGVGYTSSAGDVLNPIIDPSIIASTVRTIFEAVGMFSTVNVLPKSEEERMIVYNLWAIAGLKFRQSLVTPTSTQENRDKAAAELQQIVALTNEIEQSTVFKSLSQKSKDKIYSRISQKEYDIYFDNNNVKCIGGFQEMVKFTGLKHGIMDRIYTYFSLNSHPSFVSVFQFAEMFAQENPEFVNLTKFNLDLAFMLISVFIADYIKVFPDSKDIFETLSIRDQCVINFFNKLVRGEEFNINDCLDSLN